MAIETGGPAFPELHLSQSRDTGDVTHYEYLPGLTLRDYFAAKAMAAMIATSNGPCAVGGLQGAESEAAKSAYKMADAMLAERAK